jgi:hypothetical protein
MAERWRRSNDKELPLWSAVARGAPTAPRVREGCEGRLQLKKHRTMVALTVEGEENVVAAATRPTPVRELELRCPAWTRGRGLRRGVARCFEASGARRGEKGRGRWPVLFLQWHSGVGDGRSRVIWRRRHTSGVGEGPSLVVERRSSAGNDARPVGEGGVQHMRSVQKVGKGGRMTGGVPATVAGGDSI